MHIDKAMLMARQIRIMNGEKIMGLGTLDFIGWMKANGKKPGDDCTGYGG